MFRKLKARASRAAQFRKIDRLADEAIAAAADAFESGEFQWTRGYLLIGDNGFAKDPEYDELDTAVRGCLLGGISKYAWVVTGKPKFGTPEWRLAKAVEVRAYQRAFVSTITKNEMVPDNLNDRHAVDGVNTVVQALRDSIGAKAESLPSVSAEVLGDRIENETRNPYNGQHADLLQELYDTQS